MQSVELLLDPATDAAVRAEWAALSGAGLPSQADHRGESNAPHVSVAVADGFPEEGEDALVATARALPVPVRLGPPVLLGGRRLVLARLVVVDRPVLDLHASVATALTGSTGPSPHTAPGRWVPHVTLARGLPAEALASALGVLRGADGAVPELTGEAVELRRWDSVARRAWSVHTA
ncbi:2'-5' RNA ligase family protein [Pedococcus ginsenosidimutans]|uniref:2'-5' RNA ligase family protein n=1 Tax=Pedococcus ginsenosidimutans TaxID=490570 RepID=A0ABP8Y4M8_9MICO